MKRIVYDKLDRLRSKFVVTYYSHFAWAWRNENLGSPDGHSNAWSFENKHYIYYCVKLWRKCLAGFQSCPTNVVYLKFVVSEMWKTTVTYHSCGKSPTRYQIFLHILISILVPMCVHRLLRNSSTLQWGLGFILVHDVYKLNVLFDACNWLLSAVHALCLFLKSI